ncbi:hypothetical protein A9995_04405 [Erythrobacter sp. QSSC1-22B]|nr:hypothetical protein A9995_04405 [Erythrobacter sp. QSSC1-22B]
MPDDSCKIYVGCDFLTQGDMDLLKRFGDPLLDREWERGAPFCKAGDRWQFHRQDQHMLAMDKDDRGPLVEIDHTGQPVSLETPYSARITVDFPMILARNCRL